ncbi:MAG: hypothetical protein IPJ53_13360 [Saprospiraceae bacterium]|nr:hypothetical protein [Candidatus Vicinibacter affinis]
MKESFLKFYLIALTLFVISCNQSDFEDLPDSKIYSEDQAILYDDISYVGNDTQLGKYLEDIVSQIRDFKRANPSVSDKGINLFTEKVIKSINLNRNDLNSRAYTDMDGYLSSKLNAKELALYNSNKSKALLCMFNGKLAISYAASNYVDAVLHNGNGDAFRHTLWNFGMTIDVGSTFAKTWSDAHEYGTIGQPSIERTMDLFNNSVGIQLGKDYPYTILHSTFISKSKEKARSGKLYIIKQNKLYWSNSYGEK